MSLFKQIAILVSSVFTLLFIVILVVSFTIIKQSAQKSLYENAQNSASSISLSMTNTGLDEGSIKTLINASFDNGNYEKIVFKDMDNSVVYERLKQTEDDAMPSWFLHFVDMKEIGAKVNISSGWNLVGTLEVYNDRALFYTPMYEIFKSFIITMGLIFFILLNILAALVHILLKPLFVIEKQAFGVMHNQFIIENKMPFTLEFKSLTRSINGMIEKIQSIFENANAALRQNKELLYFDAATKLHNRHYFSLKASEYILEKGGFSQGVMVIVGISRVDLLNKLIGYQKTDAYFELIAEEFKTAFDKISGNLIARLNGTEFVAIIPCAHVNEFQSEIEMFSNTIQKQFQELHIEDDKIELTLGYCQYNNEENVGKLFSKIDYTLSQAKLSKTQNYLNMEKNALDMGKEEWREILKSAIEEDSFELYFRSIINQKNETTLYKEMSFYLKTPEREYSYSEFISSVLELRMLADVYMNVIQKVLNNAHDATPIIVYLPYQFIECSKSYNYFQNMLEALSKNPNKRIIFEISEDSLMKHYSCSVHIIELIKSFGYEFAVCNFIASSDDYTFLKELKPKFIKASKNFILDSQQNINLTKIMMQSLGLDMVVDDVENQDEIDALKKMHLYTIKMK